jgi:hypothetical protein
MMGVLAIRWKVTRTEKHQTNGIIYLSQFLYCVDMLVGCRYACRSDRLPQKFEAKATRREIVLIFVGLAFIIRDGRSFGQEHEGKLDLVLYVKNNGSK